MYNKPTAEKDNLDEELTDKTIRSGDKIKVARVIADMLGVENAESLSPEAAVNAGLRKIKNKRMTPELTKVLHKMIALAHEVGIKCDEKLLPTAMKEEVQKGDSVWAKHPKERYKTLTGNVVDTNSTHTKIKHYDGSIGVYPNHDVSHDFEKLNPNPYKKESVDEENEKAKMVLRYKDFIKKADGSDTSGQITPKGTAEPKEKNPGGEEEDEPGHTTDVGDQDHLRRIKNNYRTEELDQVDEDITSADYKTSSRTGRKYPAHRIDFQNSKMDASPEDGDGEKPKHKKHKPLLKKIGEDVEDHNEDHDEDFSEEDLNQMVATVDNEDDLYDLYDDGELVVVDDDTGEEIKDDVKEEALNEVLSRIERMKAKARFARTQSKRERRIKIALKSHSTPAKINSRARKLAVNLMKQRIMKKPAAQMSIAEKERVEKIIAKKKEVINRLALKLAPRIRKIENERLSHSKVTK